MKTNAELLDEYTLLENHFGSQHPERLTTLVDLRKEILSRMAQSPEEKLRVQYDTAQREYNLLIGRLDTAKPENNEIIHKRMLTLNSTMIDTLKRLI